MWFTRRRFLTGTGALALGAVGCVRAGSPAAPSATAIPYIDGLSLFPSDAGDFAAAHLAAGLFDVSDVEPVLQPDGSTAFRRTFARCRTPYCAASETVVE